MIARIEKEEELELKDFLAKLDNVSGDGDKWKTRCPAHDDHNPSLKVSLAPDGKILIHCFVGCEPEKVVKAMGLSMADLFPQNSQLDPPPESSSSENLLERVARIKSVSPESLHAYGALVKGNVVSIPMFGPDREQCSNYYLTDDGGKGKNAKGKPSGLFFPGRFPKPGETWHTCEGVKDAAALYDQGILAVGLPGATMKPEFAPLFKDVKVKLIPDRDIAGEGEAQKNGSILYGIASEIRVVTLPAEFKSKGGADVRDVLAQKGGKKALLRAIEEAHEWLPGSDNGDCPYHETKEGLVWEKPTAQGSEQVRLANFTARIVSEVRLDDGVEEMMEFGIEAKLDNNTYRFTVPSKKFSPLSWISEYLGAEAILYPGFALKDHTRCAIQMLSKEIRKREIFRHTGWRKINDQWHYLHAGGAINAEGMSTDLEVSLDNGLTGLCLPCPPTGDVLIEAIRASLRLCDGLLPETLAFPLLAAPYRAAAGDVDFSIHMSGPTGGFKTEIAALLQQHFGKSLTARNLPANWSSTANAIEMIAFQAKDALLAVDDFAPAGNIYQLSRAHADADRIFRAQGNLSGRQRLRSDGSLRLPKPPRGMILSTGEDIPRGHSLRARLLVLEIGRGDVDVVKLSECQKDAAQGEYEEAMAGFIHWLAGRYERIREQRTKRMVKLRAELMGGNHHSRVPTIFAELLIGLELFLAYARDADALNEEDIKRLRTSGKEAIRQLCYSQSQHQSSEEPAHRFLRLIGASISSGWAFIASPEGDAPSDPKSYGWRWETFGTGDNQREEWKSNGKCLGWVEDDDVVYLQPEASFAEAQRLANQQGEALAVTPGTLRKRLKEQGLLAKWDEKRGRLTIRKKFDNRQRTVLAIKPGSLFE